MKFFYYLFVVTIAATTLNSCTNAELDSLAEVETSNKAKTEALKTFNKAFKADFNNLAITRSIIADSNDDDYEILMAKSGRDICKELEQNTNDLLQKFGLDDQMLMDEYNQNFDINESATNFEEYKCFTALSIYDTYISDLNATPSTRVEALDVVSCIGLGITTKQLFDLPGRAIAKFAAKKLAGRLIPYVGWGWGVASATYCISKL